MGGHVATSCGQPAIQKSTYWTSKAYLQWGLEEEVLVVTAARISCAFQYVYGHGVCTTEVLFSRCANCTIQEPIYVLIY